MRRKRQHGVALVITLILLSVITLTAITFLIVSRRQKGAVATSTDQTVAQLAADTGLAREQAEILSTVMALSNKFAYNLKVTTNYINPFGFEPDNSELTNASYTYADGTPLDNADDIVRNSANLFYSPRPPVYIFTNRLRTGSPEFRYYLDLNRNGRYDTNGFVWAMGPNGGYLQPDGSEGPTPGVKTFVVGDPEWIGILERPDEPHGPDNRFVARYATVVVPSGKTLDMNRVHNEAALGTSASSANASFRRNMNAGTWEMNLAAFLVDLNTNVWIAPDDPRPNFYRYNPLARIPAIEGLAFRDADDILAYRYDPRGIYGLRPWAGLRSFTESLGNQARIPFKTDLIDSYGAGPNYLTGLWPTVDDDTRREGQPGWPGDDNPQHYASPGDFLDQRKVGAGFASRLRNIGVNYAPTNNSTYNRYTFYRLLSQLGTDGGLERRDKVNLNWDNRNPYLNGKPDVNGVASVTNFVPWRPVDFFLAAGDAVLKSTFKGVRGPLSEISITNIPVFVEGLGQFTYTPSMHRALQVAANVLDASSADLTNRVDKTPDPGRGIPATYAPSVFKPIFTYRTGPNEGVYITNWVQVTDVSGPNDPVFFTDPTRRGGRTGLRAIDLEDPAQRERIVRTKSINPYANVYGVPWVIGARKDLPNFNELAMQSVFEITRKLQIDKDLGATNQLFFVGVSNAVAVEAWNSYAHEIPEGVDIVVDNVMLCGLAVSNQFLSGAPRGSSEWSWAHVHGSTNLTRKWQGRGAVNNPNRLSFTVPVYTNFAAFPESILTRNGDLEPNTDRAWSEASSTRGGALPVPVIKLYTTNRLQFYMLANGENGRKRIIDYVHVRYRSERDITREVEESEGTATDRAMWDSERVQRAGNLPRGVLNQILVALGLRPVQDFVWDDFSFRPGTETKGQAIANFMAFYYERNATYAGYRGIYSRTNTVMQVPFSPSRRIEQYVSLQANDPLVHYTVGDLQNLEQGDGIRQLSLRSRVPWLEDRNLHKLNDRYQPWGGNPSSSAEGGSIGARNYNVALKDPGIRFSDDWTFPTNKFPNVGWLGRVHRGTPWQTINLKSEMVESQSPGQGGGLEEWQKWIGNQNRRDAQRMLPSEDRKLFDIFTTALNDNATAGQLSVNQDGLAAWSAVLSGVIAFTNPAPGTYAPFIIPPAGVQGTNSGVGRIVAGINRERAKLASGSYTNTGDILAAPELTLQSPFLNTTNPKDDRLPDEVYERIAQQIMGLLRGDEQPRFEVYTYGQALKPAERSLVTSGPFYGMCTNYQIMAEVAIRAVVRVEGAPDHPRVVLESYNVLEPD